jgi:AcrR family transcriptional regulator
MDDGRIAGVATARYARKKEAILAAATAILNRQGVRGMTLADVAARVGLITTSVTYYYRKKDDLAAACFMRGLERFDAMIAQAAAQPDPPSRLKTFIDLYLDPTRRSDDRRPHDQFDAERRRRPGRLGAWGRA